MRIIARNKLGYHDYRLFLVLVFRLSLDYLYKQIIATHYAYQKFYDNTSLFLFIVSYVLLISGSFLLARIDREKTIKASRIIIDTLFYLSFVPFTSMVRFGTINTSFIIGNSVYWFSILVLLCLKFKKNNSSITLFQGAVFSDSFAYLLGLVSVATVVYISARYTHFRFHFNLLTVYELRAEARTFNMPLILSYLFSWSRTVNSLMIGYSLFRKNKTGVFLFSFAQLLSFGIDGMKSSIFMPLVVFVLFFFKNKLKKINYSIWFNLGLFAGSIVSILQSVFTNSYMIGYLIFYRMLFLPVKISSYYWDFFSTNVPDFYRSSFLRHFGIESPYSKYGINFLISGLYFGDYTGSANNGLVSDAVTNFGVWGVIIMPIVLVLVLKLIDRCTEKLNAVLVLIIAVQFAISLVNNFITIALLTQGGLVMCFLAYMIGNTEERLRVSQIPE